MAQMLPVNRDGRRVMVRVAGDGLRDASVREDEDKRIERIAINRLYYEGGQYDAANADYAASCRPPVPVERLPEHKRLHAYSTQIAESVNFIANQLTEGFRMIAESADVQEVLDATVAATDLLSNGDQDDEELSFDDVLVEACVAGDVPYEVLWDPIEETTYLEFWPAEQVEMDVPHGNYVKSVTRRETIFVEDDASTDPNAEKQVEERIVYEIARNDLGQKECRRSVFWDEEEAPKKVEWLGLPVIPWGILRADKKGIRGFRGEPLITPLALRNADRYNAVEQVSYLIARYNSHGNLVVVGDSSLVQLEEESKVHKDIADVLRFPGGTNAFALTLPTDPQMIEHQRAVTSDAMYAAFGLVRVEPDTLQGLGSVSGYALEILNRKSEGTFRRIRRMFKRDCQRMVDLVLDVYAYRSGAIITDDELIEMYEDGAVEVPEGMIPEIPFWDIDPDEEFPNRTVDVRMGSGYIVDDVQVRDDFTAGLISREEALRKRGYSDPEIKDILGEISQQDQTEGTTGTETEEPDTPESLVLNALGAQVTPPASPIGAGSTIGSTERE